MTDRYDPTEAQIARVLEKTGGDPRKIAIAYLRADKRARDAETSFAVMGEVADLTRSTMTGNVDGVREAVERAKQHLRRHREISE